MARHSDAGGGGPRKKASLASRLGMHGYVTLLGLQPLGPHELVQHVERGLPYAAIVSFQEHAGLSGQELADWVRVKPRTLDRRRTEGRLRPDESDRLLRASWILGLALDLFEGDAERARAWLRSEQPALGGATPLAWSRTGPGAREVERLIGRLEHGVYS